MSQYDYTKSPVATDKLTKEIQDSAIVTALDHINTLGDALSIYFKADLSNDDHTILDSLVASHDGISLPDAPAAVAIVNNPIVITQFELNDKDLKIASGEAAVDGSSLAVINFLTPGTFTNGDCRWLSAGKAWFDAPHALDRITEINIIDTNNNLGYGAGVVIKTYHDTEIDASQSGWRIPNVRGFIEVETLAGYGKLPAEFTLQVKAQKGGGITTGYFFVNLEWGKSG